MATSEEIRERLILESADFKEVAVDENLVRFELGDYDAIINVWASTGTCQVQGRDQSDVEQILEGLVGTGRRKVRRLFSRESTPADSDPKQVFVVYGHDTGAITEIDAMLRRWGLEPLIIDQLPSHGNTIIEKLEHYQQGVAWAVVLLTPDDIGHPALDPGSAAPRPRQNVVLEMGMLLGRLGRAHVAMIYKVSEPVMELPSDIQGYIYIPYEKSVEEASHQLAKEMAAADFFSVPVQKI